MKAAFLSILLATAAFAETHQNPGSATPLPHQKYIHVVSEADSPVTQVFIKSKDGMYVAAAIRKPKGGSRYPAIIMFHGAPGGRGIEQLVGWSRGDHGGPVWERFLQEGYVVVVADYRGGNMNLMSSPSSNGVITSIDDGLAVIDYVKALPYVDPNRLNLYGVSLGGNLVMNLVSRVHVNSAIVGAPAAIWFLGIPMTAGAPAGPDRFKNVKPDPEISRKNIEPIRTPILILISSPHQCLSDTLVERKALLRGRLGWLCFHFPTLMPEHRRDKLPGWTRRIAPRRRHADQAVVSGVGIELEESSMLANQPLPISRCRKSRLHQATLCRNLPDIHHPVGCDEVELVRVAHPNAALDWIL